MFDYSKKVISVEEALRLVESGDNITVGLGACEPQLFLRDLHTIADKVSDVRITNCLPLAKADYMDPKNLEHAFLIDSWFYTVDLRRLHPSGRISYIPNHLHLAGKKRNDLRKANILICSASMPEENGRFHLVCSNTYESVIAENADCIILEISPNVPFSFGENYFEWDEVDYLIECDYSPCVLPSVATSDKDRIIGAFIADLINDGDCVQIGIGGIPNAVCELLRGKKDLGIHTEMISTGIMDLMKDGTVNGSQKQIDKGKAVCAFAMGSSELYRFMDHNPDILINPGHIVNDPYIIAKNDNQVSINTTVEIDLTGQCCSESIGSRQISGTGGQSDTATGAQMSKNGRSIIALHSTATIKDADSGEKKEISKIVPFLQPGAAVSLSRNDIHWVVTEFGAINLRGMTVRERASSLISIAHPVFRDELEVAARSMLLL